MAVPAIVDHVPEDVRLEREVRRRRERSRVRRQVDAEDVRAPERGAPVARRLAVAEDRPEVVGRSLGHAHRLGEEHRALAVVARGVVHQLHRDELGVVVELAFDLRDELGPGGPDDQRLEARVRRAVGRVHREDDEVLHAVAPLEVGAEEGERVLEVRLAAAALDPGVQVGDDLGQVLLPGAGTGARGRRRPRPSSPPAPALLRHRAGRGRPRPWAPAGDAARRSHP